MNALATIKRFARTPDKRERCALCALAVGAEHAHLFEVATGEIRCACEACAILFSYEKNGRFRRVPRDIYVLDNFRLSAALWERFGIPIGVSFFFRSTRAGKIRSVYPSPAGPMESLLPLDAWDELLVENPGLQNLEPDIEALLVRRVQDSGAYFRAPIDECYRLVGLIRANWSGLSGGSAVEKAVAEFFERLKTRGHSVA